ncbi:hypothetical protein [Thermomonospora echinospora]|uniref:hypothetical protein n=1 Tax=Thermomonospora echinospora TaxID=1992 RepID=UPI0011B0ECFF|nr:hypothetical protein [Thermomonospora echinospora]
MAATDFICSVAEVSAAGAVVRRLPDVAARVDLLPAVVFVRPPVVLRAVPVFPAAVLFARVAVLRPVRDVVFAGT